MAHIGHTTVGVRIFDKFALRRSLDYQLVVILAGAHACDCDSAAMEPRIQYAQTADGVRRRLDQAVRPGAREILQLAVVVVVAGEQALGKWAMPMIPSFSKVRVAMHRLCYQLTGGAIGGESLGVPILLLTTTGRKTGKSRTTPVLYMTHGENIVVVASNGGRPRHPLWWLNLQKNPEAEVQVRREKRRVKAEEASGKERARLWRLLVTAFPLYQEFQKATNRKIPVVVLRPRE